MNKLCHLILPKSQRGSCPLHPCLCSQVQKYALSTASVISMQLPVLCHCLHDPKEYLRPPLSTQMQQLVFKELSFNPLFPPFGFLLFWAMVPQFPRSKDEELLGI